MTEQDGLERSNVTSLAESTLGSDYDELRKMLKEHEIALQIVADTEAKMHICFNMCSLVSGIALIIAFCALLLGLS